MSTDVELGLAIDQCRLPIYDRYLASYPGTAERIYYLALIVLATVADATSPTALLIQARLATLLALDPP